VAEITHGDIDDTVDFLEEMLKNPNASKRLRSIIGPAAFGQVVDKIGSINTQSEQVPPEEKQHRETEGSNPVLERIASRAKTHTGVFRSGVVKNSAKGGRVKLSAFLAKAFAYVDGPMKYAARNLRWDEGEDPRILI